MRVHPHTLQHLFEEDRDMDSPENNDPSTRDQGISLVQVEWIVWMPGVVETRQPIGSQVESMFEEQVQRLSWFPLQDADWIHTVVQRELARAFWDIAEHTLILRPEEPLLNVQLEIRATWDHPDHFDLPGLLWSHWGDLNLVRFRIYEVHSHFQVGYYPGLVTLLIRPHRWGLGPETKVILIEVVRMQWQSLIFRPTAHLMRTQLTPRQLVETARIRDCTVHLCEVRREGELVWPDEDIRLVNGDLVTVLVRHEPVSQTRFTIPPLPLGTPWDARRWQSQEQYFQRDGTALILRLAGNNAAVRIPVRVWYTWEIVNHKLRHHWESYRYADIQRHSAHATWKRIDEFQEQVAVAITLVEALPKTKRVIVVLCRDEHQTARYWAQEWQQKIDEMEVISLCGKEEQCSQPSFDCAVSYNHRPLRFVQQVEVHNGDIVLLEFQSRIPFCHAGPHPVDLAHGGVGLPFGNRGGSFVSLLQTTVQFRPTQNQKTRAWVRPCTDGLRPPGNTTFWFVSQLNTMSKCVFSQGNIFVMDEVPRGGTKIRLFDHVHGHEQAKPRPIPTPVRNKDRPAMQQTKYKVALSECGSLVWSLDFGQEEKPSKVHNSIQSVPELEEVIHNMPICQWNEELMYADA